jgi:hypothetical protein
MPRLTKARLPARKTPLDANDLPHDCANATRGAYGGFARSRSRVAHAAEIRRELHVVDLQPATIAGVGGQDGHTYD